MVVEVIPARFNAPPSWAARSSACAASRGLGYPSSVFDVCSRLADQGFERIPVPNCAPTDVENHNNNIPAARDCEKLDPPSNGSSDDVHFILDVLDAAPGLKRQLLSSWHGVYRSNQLSFSVAAPSQDVPFSRQGLVSLLDIAEELGCEHATMQLSKSRDDFQELVRTLSFCGWTLVLSAPGSDPDCCTLQYDL